MALWRGRTAAVVLDAVSSDAPPGTLHRIEAASGPLPAGLACGSSHAFGLAQAIEMARALGELPERLLVLGIEGAEFTAGQGLTPAVEEAVAAAVRAVLEVTAAT